MNLPEYVTTEEVKKVCKSIGLTDWTQKTDPSVSEEEASVILEIVWFANTQLLFHLCVLFLVFLPNQL